MRSASAFRFLLALVAAGGGFAACDGSLTTVQQALEAAGVSPAAYILATSEEAVALERNGSSLALTHVFAGEDGWEVERCAGTGSEFSSIAGYFCGAEGPLVHHWNAFLYGTAANPVAHVDVQDLDVTGGEVREGLWLVAISNRDLQIGSVHWAGVSADGQLIAAGDGVPGA